MNVLIVVRGRPGLGHVIPGLAIGSELARRGHRVWIAGYALADDFLRSIDGMSYFSLDKPSHYQDWPGLDIYDDGLRRLAPFVQTNSIDLLLLGGEYLLGPLERICRVRTAMIFNPEIMISSDRNAAPARLFATLFESCSYLVPMTRLPEGQPMVEQFLPLHPRLGPPGPFTMRRPPVERDSEKDCFRVVIANGGGVSFPASLASYASVEVGPAAWLDQTREMTRQALRCAAELNGRFECLVDVFSCLPRSDNEQLAGELAGRQSIRIHSTSVQYYKALDQADLVISRAGAGFIADCETTDAAVIIWTLAGHEEQDLAAETLAARRGSTTVVRNDREMADAISKVGSLWDTEGKRLVNRPGRVAKAGERASALVDWLISRQSMATPPA